MSRASSITCISLAVMFCLFLSVQFNDVDAGIWVFAYGLAALVCLACLRQSLRPVVRHVSLLLVIGYSAWAVKLAVQTSGKWWDGEIEREVGGLAITALSMALVNFFSRQASRFS